MNTYTIVAVETVELVAITESVEEESARAAVKKFCEDRAYPSGVVIVNVFEGEPESLMLAVHHSPLPLYCSDVLDDAEEEPDREPANIR